VLPARAWGVEELSPSERMLKILDAGADQFGGEECVDLLIELVRAGRVTGERIDASAHRILRVKFQLGLFDDPFVDPTRPSASSATRSSGRRARAGAFVDGGAEPSDAGRGSPVLPLSGAGRRVYVEGFRPEDVAELGEIVADPAAADLALVRLGAPFEPRDDLFLEAWFHQGSLSSRPGASTACDGSRSSARWCSSSTSTGPASSHRLRSSRRRSSSTSAAPRAVLDVLTGRVAPEAPAGGTAAVDGCRARRSRDVPSDTGDPLFAVHFGLELAVPAGQRADR
jgi:beta-glucosidase